MLRSLRETWRSLRARQPLTVLDVIAEAEWAESVPSEAARADR
jgi:hypothetical protein